MTSHVDGPHGGVVAGGGAETVGVGVTSGFVGAGVRTGHNTARHSASILAWAAASEPHLPGATETIDERQREHIMRRCRNARPPRRANDPWGCPHV